MNNNIIVSKERMERIFKATAHQFGLDIAYLEGCLSVLKTEYDSTRYISQNSFELILSHLSAMKEMLNDFDYRLENEYER